MSRCLLWKDPPGPCRALLSGTSSPGPSSPSRSEEGRVWLGAWCSEAGTPARSLRLSRSPSNHQGDRPARSLCFPCRYGLQAGPGPQLLEDQRVTCYPGKWEPRARLSWHETKLAGNPGRVSH